MAYGVDTGSFRTLDTRLHQLPEDLPRDPRQLEGVLFAYHEAFASLLKLVMALLRICAERDARRPYVSRFLVVYDQAAERILQLLDREIREGLARQSANLVELVYAMRDGQTGAELVALDAGLSEDAGHGDPKDHLDTATTVVNSLKKQIQKHTRRKWIPSVLHVLNEVISIVRGVLGVV